MQAQMQSEYNAKVDRCPKEKDLPKMILYYKAPEGYSDHLDHFTNFFDSIRTGKPVVEDASVWLSGLRHRHYPAMKVSFKENN